jgi:hypothetical protein
MEYGCLRCLSCCVGACCANLEICRILRIICYIPQTGKTATKLEAFHAGHSSIALHPQ